jgi:ABC-2 type transport system ATP-binding protein
MSLAIETSHLTKNYGNVHAVSDLSLRVAEGEIYAFLGLNGAGKTTTIRMLLGMIKPVLGNVRVLGTTVRLGSRQPWAQVGYMVEDPRAYPELTIRENLEAARLLHPGTPRHAVGEIIERLSLSPYADRRAGTLSHGNLQRLGLAKALLHSSRLLILDEPANGLDPAGIVEIRELLRELTQQQGGTVFMSSHILAEVARLADRVGILHQGRLLQELSTVELEANRHRRLLVKVREVETARLVLANAGLDIVVLSGGTIQILSVLAVNQPEQVNSLLVEAGCPPYQLFVEEEDLEAYFLRLIGMSGEESYV